MSNKKVLFAMLAVAVIVSVIGAGYFLVFAPKPRVAEEKIIAPSIQEAAESLPEKVQSLFQDSLDEALSDIEALEL